MYRVWLLASVHNQRRNLPSVVRQRIKKIIDALAENPRPYNSIELNLQTSIIGNPDELELIRGE